jgi:hypothetical protein
VDTVLRNTAQETLTPSFYGGNTGLIDASERSYVPLAWDGEDLHEDCCRRWGAAVLPNMQYDLTMIFSLPVDRSPKELVFTVMSYHGGNSLPLDIRIPVALP